MQNIDSKNRHFRFYKIISASMAPTLNINDMVLSLKKSPKDIKAGEKDGDIVILKGPQYFYDHGMDSLLWNYLSGDVPIIHRAIDKKIMKGVYYFKTKGDNTWATDGAFRIVKRKKEYMIIEYDESNAIYVPESEILGVVEKKNPPFAKKANLEEDDNSIRNCDFINNFRKYKKLQIKVFI